ncbi:unnamed protein product, partial [Mesorhabditis belari]|uniref:B30.2/SPRY domain-containing protein n=1 Tax=Mesorhabditis belari TaxID=2138241 RepID=A0AAF3F5J2_9BILA
MSARPSRRSATSADGGLNPATIQFLDRGRLVKELESRGLSSVGAKSVLADRLYEFVVNGVRDEPEDIKPDVPLPIKESGNEETPAPQGKKRKKAASNIEELNQSTTDNIVEEPAPSKAKRGRRSTNKTPIQLVTENPSVNPFMAFLEQREAEKAAEGLQRTSDESVVEATKPTKERTQRRGSLKAVKEEPKELEAQKVTKKSAKAVESVPKEIAITPSLLQKVIKADPEELEPQQSTSAEIIPIKTEEEVQPETIESGRPKRNRIARVIATPPPEEPRRRSKPAPSTDSTPKQKQSPVKNKSVEVEMETEAPSETIEPSIRPIDDVFDDGLSSDEDTKLQSAFDSRKVTEDKDYVPEKEIHLKEEKEQKTDQERKKEKEARKIKEKEKERRRLEKEKKREKEREKPKVIPITLKWAEMREKLLKEQQETKTAAAEKAVAAEKAAAALTSQQSNNLERSTTTKEEKGSKELPKKQKGSAAPQAHARENVLDSILGDQQQFMAIWERKDKPFETTPDKMKAKMQEEKQKQAKLLEEKNRKSLQERRESRLSTSRFDLDPEKISLIPIPPPMPQLIIPPRPKTLPPTSNVQPSPSSSSTPDTQTIRLIPPPPPPKLKPIKTVPPPPPRIPPPPQVKLLQRIPPPPPRPNLMKTNVELRDAIPEIESPDDEPPILLEESEFEIRLSDPNAEPSYQSGEPSISDQFVEVLKELRDQRDVEECLMDVIDFVCSMDAVYLSTKSGSNSRKEENMDVVLKENERGSTDHSLENSESLSETENENSSTSSTPIEESSKVEDKRISPQNAKENEQRRASMDVNLLSDPVLLSKMLKTANAVLTSFQKPTEPKQEEVYVQEMPNEEELEASVIEEERPLPEFHGEPVPSDDDDALFEAAAGIPPSKRTKKKKRGEEEIEEETLPPQESFQLDYYNADLHVKCDSDKERERWWIIHPDNSDGLALMWGGVKTTFGLPIPYNYDFPDHPKRKGVPDIEIISSTINGATKENMRPRRLAFQIKILENTPIKHVPFEESEPHEVRVGFALGTSPNILGESARTWCLCSSGKKATNNVFTEWGRAGFSVGDVVTTEFDLDAQSISYWINGEERGESFSNLSFDDGDVLFPTVSAKNCKIAVNLGNYPDKSEDWGKINPLWTFPAWIDGRTLVRAKTPPESKADCTVLMMVGLPGVGKTTWVRHYLRDHPDEDWSLISPDTVLNQMKVNGVPRSRVHRGRWDMVMGLAAKSMNRYITFACRRRRNYIIDATNCGRESRKRKLTNFKDFRRKCVVIMPTDEEWQGRLARQARQDAKAIMPVECMLELKATLAIPNPETEPLEEVHFIEPTADFLQQAVDLVQRYNEEARPWLQNQHRNKRRRGGYVQQNDSRGYNNNSHSHDGTRPSWSNLMSSLQAFAHPHHTTQSTSTGPLRVTITDLTLPSPQLSASTPTTSAPDPFAASAALASGKSATSPSVVQGGVTTPQSTPIPALPPLSVATDSPTTPTPATTKQAEAIAAAAVKYYRPAGIPRSQWAKLSKQREDAIMGFHGVAEPQEVQPQVVTTPGAKPTLPLCSPIPTIGSQPPPGSFVAATRPASPPLMTSVVQPTVSTPSASVVGSSHHTPIGTPMASMPSTPVVTMPNALPDFSQPPPMMYASPVGSAMGGGMVDFSMPPPSFGMPSTPTSRPMISPLPNAQTPQQMPNAQPQYPGQMPDFSQPPPAPSWPNTFQQPPFY